MGFIAPFDEEFAIRGGHAAVLLTMPQNPVKVLHNK